MNIPDIVKLLAALIIGGVVALKIVEIMADLQQQRYTRDYEAKRQRDLEIRERWKNGED